MVLDISTILKLTRLYKPISQKTNIIEKCDEEKYGHNGKRVIMSILDKLKSFNVKNLWRDKKNKNLIANIIGTVGIKGVALAISTLSMPAYIAYFENELALGVWFSLNSILNWILTFDLGIGNGLRNQLVPELNSGNKPMMKKLISSAYFMLGTVSLVVGVIGVFLIRILDLNALLNIDKSIISPEIMFQSVSVVFLAIVIKFFLNIITSILYAMQKTALPNLIALLSTISILVFVLLYKNPSVETKFLALSYFNLFSMCAPILLATVIIFVTVLKDARPSVKHVDRKMGKRVVGLGGKFFIVQICFMVISSTNELLISKLVSPENAVSYNGYHRWFFLIITMFSLLIQPMWSSFSQAHAEKNYNWIKSIYRKFIICASMGTLGAVFLAAVFPVIVKIWLGENAGTIDVQFGYSICFASLVATTLFINSATCVANALNELRCQIIWTIVGAVIKIPLSVLLVNWLNSWIGVPLANVIVLLPLALFQNIESVRKINKLIKATNKQ